MNKKLVDVGLKSFVETIKSRLPRGGVRITRKALGPQYERLRIVFPISDKKTSLIPTAQIQTVSTPTGYTHKIEIELPANHTARMEIVSTPSGYTYRVWLETPARILELANPGVYAELEGICDAIYKLATKRDQHWNPQCPAPPIP